MAEASRYDIALLSYKEVLDATKHQDDKIGRLLAAVAFLTGGALVFAKPEILASSYLLRGRQYPLSALLLGLFLILDLAAVVIWLLTVSAPLTSPGVVAGSGSTQSYFFFRVIASTPRDTWKAMWEADKATEEAATQDLIDETFNLAWRANLKYERTRIAASVFLASAVFLLPTLVLSIDTVSHQADKAPLPWNPLRRGLLGVSIAVVPLVLSLWRWRDPVAEQSEPADRRDQLGRRRLRLLAMAQPVFIVACVVGNDEPVSSACWAALALAAGIATIWALWHLFADHRRWRAFLVGGATLLTAAGVWATLASWPDGQLLVGLLAAVLVLFENRPPLRLSGSHDEELGVLVAP